MNTTSTTKKVVLAMVAASVMFTLTTAWTPPLPHTMPIPHSENMLKDEYRNPEYNTMTGNIANWLSQQGKEINEVIGIPPAFAEGQTGPPTKDEIVTLQKAFAAFYGNQRDPKTALPLLDESIQNFERQPPDERAGLYRVRGDCKMALRNPIEAIDDYATAIDLLRLPESKNKADPVELPASM